MNEQLPRIVIVVLLLLVIGVPLLLRDATGEAVEFDQPAQGTLLIVSPHNEQIRFEITRAYNRWRQQQGKGPVIIDWRSSGGTSDLRRQVLAQFEAQARRGEEDSGIGIDLFFGGGDYEHNQLARGISVNRQGQEVRISATVPIQLPHDLKNDAFPEPFIGSERLYHPEGYWYGTALSSFGIVYNRDVLAMLGLDEPTTWADLTDPGYRNWLALADPAHSGSIAVTFETIVRRLGWEEGWAVLRRAYANARYFSSSATKVPVDVSAGEAAAGLCIDFFGRFQAGAVANPDGSSRVGYVDPAYMTAITADPISLLRGAPNEALAMEFILWSLSKESQRLWQRRRGTEHGPLRHELRRMPVRRDLYTEDEMTYWTDPDADPFGKASPMAVGMPRLHSVIAPVSHAMAIDIHADLVAAWTAINQTPRDHPNYEQMLALFDAMPPALTFRWPDDQLAYHWHEALSDPTHPRHEEAGTHLTDFVQNITTRWRDPAEGRAAGEISGRDRQLRDRLAWTRFFRANYREIVRLSRE